MSRKSQSLSPTTTEQQDIIVAGQRKINLIWEATQSFTALLITVAVIYLAVNKIDSPEVKYAFFLIIGFYFSRTNHQAIGGIGKKGDSEQEYKGR